MSVYPTPGESSGTWGAETRAFHNVTRDLTTGKVLNEALQASDTAPIADEALANKKYVDDQTTVKAYDSGWFASTQSGVYPLTHNLGSTAVLVTVLVALDDGGSPDADNTFVGMAFSLSGTGDFGPMTKIDSVNGVTIRAANNSAICYWDAVDGTLATSISGHYRVIVKRVD
jgi:hypothetical protein